MEAAFSLPSKAMLRPAVHLLLALLLGLFLASWVTPGRSLGSLVASLALPLGLVAAAAWYGARYNYIHVSSAGVRGRSAYSFKWQSVAWSESLASAAAAPYGLSGRRFTSLASGAVFFVPLAILQSAEFQAAVEQHATAEHPLRASAL